MTNTGPYDICIDEQVLYTSDATQTFFVDDEVAAGPAELAPGDSFSVHYGSWTTDNGYYSPYLGDDAWWCVENGQYAAGGASFDWYGEEIPGSLGYFVANVTDEDGDGVDDDVDWAGSYGVQANYNIWSWQADHTVLTAGKTASVSGGEVWVTLVSRNIGYDDGSGTLTDTIPASWTVSSWTVEPDTQVENGDGSLTVTWDIEVLGTAGGLVLDLVDLSYAMERDCGSDLPYLELDAASVDYFDGDDDVTSYSLPAAAYNIDVNDDGVVDCAEEELCDGVDNDLDCEIDEDFDTDADGWTSCDGDCDDDDAAVNPDATEVCNGTDDDCDGLVDDDDDSVADQSTWYADADADGYGDAADVLVSCEQPGGYEPDASDCDDADGAVNPGATEACNGIDDDCDAAVDEGFDSDADGLADCFDTEECDGLDNDGDADVDEGFDSDADGLADCFDTEECDGLDNDGDSDIDEGFDSDADGLADCFDTEECDGLDNDGDSDIDEGFDSDGDTVADCFDTEECDGVDNDGDGLVDDDDPDVSGQSTWYADADADGYGDAGSTVDACFEPSGYTDDSSDCDDSDAAVNPGALEVCNDLDDDCDGDVDEGRDGVALDCGEDDCPELEPDECLTLWQAHARGWLWVESGDGATVNFTNVGAYDVCIDERGLYTSESTPSAFASGDVVGTVELAPAETLTLYYGSWTTDNSTYMPYLGNDAWWCLINYTPTVGGHVYDWYGEEVPEVLSSFVESGWDVDSDGVDDLEDWAAAWGVQAQYTVWDYQAANPVLTAGKVAEADGGEILVTVTARNVGFIDGSGELVDTIPAGWTAAFDVAPDAEVENADGSLSVTWLVDVAGTGGGAVIDADTFTYSLVRDCGSDAPYTELPEASTVYDDNEGEHISWSMPAAAYDLDGNGDGVVDCAEEEICDGLDNDLDCEVDEDFDTDGDGWISCDGDCDDDDAAVNPDATELCNGLDDDCDGLTDDDDDSVADQGTWYADADGDGYGDAADVLVSCEQPGGYEPDDSDCDDADGAVNPGATEACNGIDDDCDADVDEGFDSDADGLADCFDSEECDGLDNDGDGDVDEGFDSDADGLADCFDAEECDGVDNDGDGLVDDDDPDVTGLGTWYADADGDGYGDAGSSVDACFEPSGFTSDDTDCDDSDADVFPGALELCNELDDDCDGDVDEELDCGEDDCPEVEPDECLTLWQAHARGWFDVESGSGGTVSFTNRGVYDICIDELGLYTASGTQSMFVEGELIGTIELAPGESLTLQYGSWTTDNGYYSPYLGSPAWWCIESGFSTTSGQDFDWYGEAVPEVLAVYTEPGWDTDADGVDDLEDWAGSYGVQAQYNIWAYQAGNAVLTAGKVAEAVDPEVWVTLTSRNIGYDDGVGELTDIIPAGWSVLAYDVTPDSEVENADGTVTVTWAVDVAGTGGGTTVDADSISYILVRDSDSDAPYLELEPAWVVYTDSEGTQSSDSMPAAVYNVDVNEDGEQDCWEEETCDGIDNDLDGAIDEDFDVDGDGWISCDGDCDDDDAAVNPDATELCNAIDDDCDGLTDDADDSVADQSTWYADADSDGYGDVADTLVSCDQPTGYVGDSSDCDDTDGAVNPGATELCNGIDDDCDAAVDEGFDSDVDGIADCFDTEECDGVDNDGDGLVDDDDDSVVDQSTWYADTDADGYGDAGSTTVACFEPDGYEPDETDCDDSDGAVNPGATEVCNGIDDDCDAAVDEGFDSDTDGLADCFDTEECDGLDNDGDGLVDDDDDSVVGQSTWYADADADGYGDLGSTTLACYQPDGWTDDATDCNDDDAAVNPGATEVCNGIDDDCDGLVDDDDSPVSGTSTWYADTDGDGYGDPRVTQTACEQPDGWTDDGSDCDDDDAAVNPAATEECDGIDNDCDALVDDDDSPVSGTSTWYSDADGDGYGDPRITTQACEQPDGWTDDGSDCDDDDAAVNPDAAEVCDGIDNDCDGLIDDDDSPVSGTSTWYADADGDGFGDPRVSTQACDEPSGWTDDGSDCDDDDAAVNPDALDLCNGIDDDCDGGVDEDEVCGDDDCEDVVPDECLTLWQAHARGWLDIGSGGIGEAITFVNSGAYDVCLDERALYASDDTQAFFLDAGITDLPEQLTTGASYTAYYGSWTTDNGSYNPYLGEGAWWCVDNGRAAAADGSYVYYGEEVPEVLATWVDTLTDVDGDGVYDLDDWAGSYGVQAQYNIWDWQMDEPVLTAGKVADEVLGEVVVTLTSRNLGDLAGEGWLVDTVPAGWTVIASEQAADHTVPYADGSTAMGWFLELDAYGGSTDMVQFSYTIARDVAADVAYLELEPAWVTYADECGSASSCITIFPPDCGGEVSSSLPAAVYNIDVDQDGVQDCPEEEVCDGLDNDLDGLVDEDLADSDADGVCDDMDVEECDGVDNDGDGEVDEDCPGSISGVVYFDDDQDGSQSFCEPGIPFVVVWVDGPDCDGDGYDDSYSTTSDQDGGYLFEDLCAGDWVVSFEERSFDNPTTDNPVEFTLVWGVDEVVDFGIHRCFWAARKCWWMSHPVEIRAALPLEVAGRSFETVHDVRAVLNGSSTCTAARLERALLLAKLNDARFGISAHPWMDYDGDGECESIADLIALAEEALATADHTSFTGWLHALADAL